MVRACVFALAVAVSFGARVADAQAGAPPGPAATPTPSPMTLRSNAQLVILDVTVTDKQGKPVHQLKQSDFSVLENKQPQTIGSFEEHVGFSSGGAAKAAVRPKTPPGVFTNEAAAPVDSALNIVLLDTLNTPLQDQAYVRDQFLAYLDKARPGASVAIFGLGTRLILLQDFTSDPAVLKQAVKLQKGVKRSPMLADPVSGNDFSMQLSEQILATGLATAEAVEHVAEFEAVQQTLALQVRAAFTLNAMNELARYLAGIPGRKNVIWFSGSFPLIVLPDTSVRPITAQGATTSGANPFAAVASFEEEFRRTIDLLSRSQVSVYPVYAQGSTAPPMFDADNGGSNGGAKYTRNPSAFANDQTSFFEKTATDHSTMEQLAFATGGEAFFDTNGLTDAVGKAIDNGSNYYTLTYTPTAARAEGEYRSLQVSLEKKGYTLAYRRSYLAEDGKSAAASAPASPAASGRPSAMQTAMQYGAPPASQLVFKLRMLPSSTELEKTAAPGNSPNQAVGAAQGPYRRYGIDFLGDASAIRFERTPDGAYRDDVEYVTCVFDVNGEAVNVMSNTVAVSFTREQYAALLRRGLPYHQEISVPAKGQYVVRVGIHDRTADRIGTVEVPVAEVEKLPPLPRAAPAGAAPGH